MCRSAPSACPPARKIRLTLSPEAFPVVRGSPGHQRLFRSADHTPANHGTASIFTGTAGSAIPGSVSGPPPSHLPASAWSSGRTIYLEQSGSGDHPGQGRAGIGSDIYTETHLYRVQKTSIPDNIPDQTKISVIFLKTQRKSEKISLLI